MDISEFSTDQNLEEEGVWISLDGNGTEIKVARMNCRPYKKYFQAITKPYKRLIRNGSLSEDLAEKLLIDALAHKIVLDWKGLTKNGKKFPYSVENATQFLSTSPDFRDLVTEAASEMDNFRQKELEEAAGN